MSAGTEPRGVHPLAVEAMREIGIALSGHRSEHVDRYLAPPADVVVTVCDSAKEACPYVPARERTILHSFEDPSAVTGAKAERLAAACATPSGTGWRPRSSPGVRRDVRRSRVRHDAAVVRS